MEPDERTKEIVSKITDHVNTFSLDSEGFIEAMSREHRTLQQSFTRLVLEWIAFVGSDEYRHDARNEGAHNTCKKMMELWNKENGNIHPDKFLGFI